ncbi:MAG: hypothetical protein QM737_16810 [Ferruginibacter sp.]
MKNIIPSTKQRTQRSLFKEAVAYAKRIISDPVIKTLWQKKIKRKNGVYNEAIKKYLLIAKNKKEQSLLITAQLINQSFNNKPIKEIKESLPTNNDIYTEPLHWSKTQSRILL